ncbi:hypothetical protein SCHPADRAFT_728437 [Schizopora paradoxa]|uniref:Uncharacterized protein n=1 Tax=Schizopora paradoxa TaxID=27342 RepID=A0A0H2R7C8_9AGAM|nr:hypothetical protein SCHPADRAFT_728437 [Schizopora paradoxa]
MSSLDLAPFLRLIRGTSRWTRKHRDGTSASTTISSAAQNLPEDLLYTIFLHTLPSHIRFSTKSIVFNMVTPLNLSWVCRSWRAIVLSRPRLWSEIDILGGFQTNSKKELKNLITRLQRGIEKWLSLSSLSPLWLHLRIIGDVNHLFPREILPLFLSESYRWTSIHIDNDCGIPYRNVRVSQIQAPFTLHFSPEITSLHLQLHHQNSPKAIVDLSQLVNGVDSHLGHLSLRSSFSVKLPPLRDALSLPSLFYLNYAFAGIEEDDHFEKFLCILRASPQLAVLSLENRGKSDFARTSGHSRDSVHLPHLFTLFVTVSDLLSNDYFLGVLVCPSLNELSLFVSDLDVVDLNTVVCASPVLERIHKFLLRQCAGAPIRRLSLTFRAFETMSAPTPTLAPALRSLLGFLDNLKVLALERFPLTYVVIKMLSISRNEPSQILLCPSLSEISLSPPSDWKEYNFTEEDIEELVVSRWKSGNLRRVKLEFPLFGALKKRERIAECIREGLSTSNALFG